METSVVLAVQRVRAFCHCWASRPLVIVVEDGEHIDSASLKVLNELHTSKILMLVGVRAKGIAKDSPMAGCVGEPEHDNGHHTSTSGSSLARARPRSTGT